MATLNMQINVPDEIAQKVLVDFTDFQGYQEKILDEKTGEMLINPAGRAQFMKHAIIKFIKESVKTHRARKAVELATNIDEAEIT